MNIIKKYIYVFIISIFIFFLFKYNNELKNIVNASINIWINNVFPSFFFIFIIGDILVHNGIMHNKNIEIFLLSFICGMPTSSYLISNSLEKGLITKEDANRLIKYTYFCNPLFLYTILSISFNRLIIIKIIISHYLSNIIMALFIYKHNRTYINNNNNKTNIISRIPKSINKSINTLLMILGVITFYMFIIFIINKIFNFSNNTIIIITGLIEITQGLRGLNNLNCLQIIKEIIALSIISFGGLSIHTQVYSFINNTKISYKNYLVGRILQVIISIIIYVLLQVPILLVPFAGKVLISVKL